ncbi:MAG: hypothetical protein NTV80_10665 [Verrucomicrobia bacterium]|nr:hypothetical protein [Verrucomicrobiota bacterium]
MAIFHFVVAGLAFAGLGFLFLHYLVVHTFLADPGIWKNNPNSGGPPPEILFDIFKWFYVVIGALFTAGAIANLLSGLWIRKRKNRVFSLIIAGINCIQFPFGTALGVFTLVVLLRDSVRESYEAQEMPSLS